MTTDNNYTLDRLQRGELVIDYRVPKMPLYVSVYDVLSKLIKNGELSRGDKIPSEYELSEYLGVARSTVRMALLVLQEDGLVRTRQGKGTFVEETGRGTFVAKGGVPFCIREFIERSGRQYSSAKESFSIVPSEEYLCAKLGLDGENNVGLFQMVHCVDGVPAVLSQDFFIADGSEEKCTDFFELRRRFEDRVKREYDSIQTSFIPTVSKGDRKMLLETSPSDLLLLVSQDICNGGGTIVFSKNYYNTAVIKYAVTEAR